jgi:hypothetical protein
MRAYRVRFNWKNGRYEEMITASSAQAARQSVEARYPGAHGIIVMPA